MSPTVSVLVPCYRSAKFVDRALHSIASQTYQDWEAVVVDNASDDETFALAERFARRDSRFRVHRNAENVGPVRNWQRCAELGSGEYACFLFSDDWYEPRFLERTTELITDPAVGFVFSGVRIVYERAGSPTRSERAFSIGGGPIIDSDVFLREILECRRSRVPVSPGCGVARRLDMLRWLSAPLEPKELGFLKHGAGPDVAIYLQGCVDYPRFGHVPDPLVNFSSHGGNLTGAPNVAVAYGAVFHRFARAHAGRVDVARAAAKAWWLTRRHEYRKEVTRDMTWRSWLAIADMSLRRAFERVADRAGLT